MYFIIKVTLIYLSINFIILVQSNYSCNIQINSDRIKLFESAIIDFQLIPRGSSYQYRYKLDVPSDWTGGLIYAYNQWTDWLDGSDGHIVFKNFNIEGDYKFVIEFKATKNNKTIARGEKVFKVYLEYPEIEEAELLIDYNKIILAGDMKERYKIAAQEYKKSYLAWNQRFEYQYKLLKLSASIDFIDELVKIGVEELTWKFVEEGIKSNSASALAKGATTWLQKVFLPITVYDIIKQCGVNLILIYRNIQANKASIMTAASYKLWKYFEHKVETIDNIENFSKNKNIFLILDSSGSMRENDRNDNRKTASKIFIDKLYGNENLFIIDFDQEANWLNRGDYSTRNKNLLKSAIDRIDSEGGTNLGAALTEASGIIKSKKLLNSKSYILFLTDGKGTYNNEHVWFKESNIPIYTISLGSDINESLLQNMAIETEGEFTKARNSNDIVAAFNKIINRIQNNNRIFSKKDLIRQNEVKKYSFYIEPQNNYLNSTLSWPGSKISLTLKNPAGEVFSSERGNGNWEIGGNYLVFNLEKPLKGKWSAELTGVEIPSNTEPFNFEISSNSRYNFDLVSSSKNKFNFELFNEGFAPVINSCEAILTTPQNTTVDISNSFNGKNINFIPTHGEGNYNLDIKFFGKIEEDNFQREFSKSIYTVEEDYWNSFNVSDVSGNYLSSPLNIYFGLFPGIRCTLLSDKNGDKKARGVIISVSENDCTIEIIQFLSNEKIEIGDKIQLNNTDWSAD
jgi:Mg-chelatase subunit ChlD